MKKYVFTLSLLGIAVSALAPPNCNIYSYNGDTACYNGCDWAMKAIQHPQGSKTSQEYFDKAIATCPSLAYAYKEKAVPYLKRGDFITWFSLIDKAVEISPEEYLGVRAWDRFQFMDDYDGAIADIERVMELKNYDIGYGVNGMYHLLFTRALCYKQKGDLKKAIALMEEYLNSEIGYPDLSNYIHLGVCYLNTGQHLKAIAALERQILEADYYAESYFYLGQCYQAMGQINEAKSYFQKAAELYSNAKFLADSYTAPPDRIYKQDIEKALAQLEMHSSI